MTRTIRIACFAVFASLALYMACLDDTTTGPPKEVLDVPGVENINPPKNGTGASRTPIFIWKKTTGESVHHYLLTVARSEDSHQMVSETTVDTFMPCPVAFEEMTQYHWSVNVFTYNNKVLRGDWWRFTTGTGFNNPPVVPFDPVPADGSSNNPLYQVLSWGCYDPDGDDVTYDVWLDTVSGDSVLIADDTSIKTADPGGLNPDRRYLWKVVAHDEQGDSTIGPWWDFKTITASNKPPIEPWGPSPANGATNMLLDLTLSWNCEDPEDDPITYTVSIGLAGGNLTIVGSDLTETSFEVTDLDPYTAYDWLVSATDDHYNVKYGPLWSFTTGDGVPVREVFAALDLRRTITYDGSIHRFDWITARFDSLYAPGLAINPLQPGSVSCGAFDLTWVPGSQYYSYTDLVAGYFLNPGGSYIFTITEGDGVPALTSESILFPGCSPYITSPAPFSEVSLDGFDLEWHTFCSGTIDIVIDDLTGDSTGVYIRTEDDGFYSFTAEDLAPIDAFAYQLKIVLINENRKTITAQGYDPRSYLWARTLSEQYVNVQQP